jgi:hypothetical protein
LESCIATILAPFENPYLAMQYQISTSTLSVLYTFLQPERHTLLLKTSAGTATKYLEFVVPLHQMILV